MSPSPLCGQMLGRGIIADKTQYKINFFGSDHHLATVGPQELPESCQETSGGLQRVHQVVSQSICLLRHPCCGILVAPSLYRYRELLVGFLLWYPIRFPHMGFKKICLGSLARVILENVQPSRHFCIASVKNAS